jgi:hypothetical protein
MTDALLALARAQAEKAGPAVRAGALLRIARVMTVSDRAQARRILELGLEAMGEISGEEGEALREDAQVITAAVAPDLIGAVSLTGDVHMPAHYLSDRIGRSMLDHGFIDDAVQYVAGFDDSASFPFGLAHDLVLRVDDPRRLAVFRAAISAWRAARRNPHPHYRGQNMAFIRLFRTKWELLPLKEAKALLHEIVQAAMDEPDQRVSHSWGNEDGVKIASSRAASLFRILDVVRHLDESLAQSLIAGHEELAKAAARFPYGEQTMMEEAEARWANAGANGKPGRFLCGASRDMTYANALMDAGEDGDFQPAFAAAMERYREDTAPENPNEALKQAWPSSCMFRQILYKAGGRLGDAAAAYLDQIPDDDQRLFAQIELAAALAKLPEMQETQRSRQRRASGSGGIVSSHLISLSRATEEEWNAATRRAAELEAQGAVFRCPKCRYVPGAGARWVCICGHYWNTFSTGGICPTCQRAWKETACPSCRGWSEHGRWYGDT